MKSKLNQIATKACANQKKIQEILDELNRQAKNPEAQDRLTPEKELLFYANSNESMLIHVSENILRTIELIRSSCNETETKILEGDMNFNTCGILQGLESELDRAIMEIHCYEKARRLYRHIIELDLEQQ